MGMAVKQAQDWNADSKTAGDGNPASKEMASAVALEQVDNHKVYFDSLFLNAATWHGVDDGHQTMKRGPCISGTKSSIVTSHAFSSSSPPSKLCHSRKQDSVAYINIEA